MSDLVRNSVLRSLRKLFGAGTTEAGTSDADLLGRFVQKRDESAFELLLWRHAGLVLAVCRQVLRDEQDAEDAFQATFLVLLRKAGAISRRESLPGWLHRVAYRVALRARARAGREKQRRQASDLDAVAAPAGAGGLEPDLAELLHAEVSRLPPRYRVPVVCCYLEGRTHEEAARELGWSKGTVAGRLARARALLARRLARRGVTLGAAGLAVDAAAGAGAAAAWGRQVARFLSVVRGLANGTQAAGLPAAALAEGVIDDMFRAKLRWAAAALLSLSVAGLGAGVVASRQPLGPRLGGEAAAERPAEDQPRAGKALPAARPADPLDDALRRVQVRRRLKTIGLALHNYHDAQGYLPPPASLGKDGKALLSWRVAILPYVEQDNLYRQFRLDEPWDSPHNKKLIARMPAVFGPAGQGAAAGRTAFQYIVGPGAVFSSRLL